MRKIIFLLLPLLYSVSAWCGGDYHSYALEKNRVNAEGDLAVIAHFHKRFPSLPYVIVDKKMRSVSLYEYGELKAKTGIQVYAGDEVDKGGAGIYHYAGNQERFHYGVAEKDGSVHALFVGEFKIAKNTVMYVLPETTEHRFRIRNRVITFNAARVKRNRPEFNYTPFNGTVQESQITVDMTESLPREYAYALQTEKATLMQLLHLENDEYNMLAEFAFGVLGPETEFGTGWKYQLKQNIPFIVSIAKGQGLNTEHNSRGPTQLKKIPDIITETYGFNKDDLWIAKNAAVATLAFAADLLIEIRNRAVQHEGITEETLQDYMYYLYQGLHHEVIQGTATPDKNINIQKIHEAVEHLRIEDLM